MGNETYLYFSTSSGGPQRVARIRSSIGFEVGKKSTLLMDLERAHFFDSATKAAHVLIRNKK
jgi:hypothetical protein